jgi:hypothetical protein
MNTFNTFMSSVFLAFLLLASGGKHIYLVSFSLQFIKSSNQRQSNETLILYYLRLAVKSLYRSAS